MDLAEVTVPEMGAAAYPFPQNAVLGLQVHI